VALQQRLEGPLIVNSAADGPDVLKWLMRRDQSWKMTDIRQPFDRHDLACSARTFSDRMEDAEADAVLEECRLCSAVHRIGDRAVRLSDDFAVPQEVDVIALARSIESNSKVAVRV
ncbi:MAG TPA: hypothetical protein PJ982_07020, partial [Lacipirellulaceae bacterium]|nr:hypothetical protein [Lacipirellulaceae bacterium]